MNKLSATKKSPVFWVAVFATLIIGVLIGRFSQSNTPSPLSNDTHKKPQTNNSEQQKAVVMMVEAATPIPVEVTETLDATGIIHAKDTAEVSGKLTGTTIEKVLVDVGDTVKAGQVLAVLDSQALKDTLVQAEADLALSHANLKKAEADLARVEPLLKIDAISRQEVDNYRTILAQTKATITSNEARLNNAKTNLKNTLIVAPVSGIISSKTAEVGLLVNGSSLFSIIKNGQLEWRAVIDPKDASKLSGGQSAVLALNNDESITGKLSHLSPTADNSHQLIAYVLLPNNKKIKAGMYQAGQFILSFEQKLALPVSAVMTTDGYDYVWVLHPNTSQNTYTVKRAKITTHNRIGDKIVAEIDKNAIVVAKSTSFLSENDIVGVAFINNQAVSNEVK
ncbi:MAG: efflux RND transporter periplasmic adaptor subunit [Moraxella sp.]|nr:MAG: efflux RND transporter periplasmic adaptor subunit [Moraxella sp.]